MSLLSLIVDLQLSQKLLIFSFQLTIHQKPKVIENIGVIELLSIHISIQWATEFQWIHMFSVRIPRIDPVQHPHHGLEIQAFALGDRVAVVG